MLYVFLYFRRGSPEPVAERRALPSDAEARTRAASELLQMPARNGVDVWDGERLVYRRRRGGSCALTAYPADLQSLRSQAMSNNEVDQGIKVNANAGIGQERVGEPGPGVLQKAKLPPAAGGPGTGSGADAASNSEDQRARSGPDVYAGASPEANGA